jgi:DNA-binding winged helix-turn-helix (wHTH) protein
MNRVQNPRVVRFGPFEADLYTRELRKHGFKLKLQGQPFQVLAMLLDRPGDLVTREEIRSKLWPQDTFIDFDNGLNAAVRRVREALNDNAETPRFVETLPRRGYRFIAPVEKPSIEKTEQSELGLFSNPALAINGATETGASPLETGALPNVVDHGPEADFQGGSMATKPAAAAVEPEVSSNVTSQPSASVSQQLVLPRAGDARASKRVKVLLAAIAILAVVAAAFVTHQLGSKRAKQPAIRSLAFSLYRIFLVIRHSNTSQME